MNSFGSRVLWLHAMPEVGFVRGEVGKACVYLIFMDIAQTPPVEVLQIHDTPQ